MNELWDNGVDARLNAHQAKFHTRNGLSSHKNISTIRIGGNHLRSSFFCSLMKCEGYTLRKTNVRLPSSKAPNKLTSCPLSSHDPVKFQCEFANILKVCYLRTVGLNYRIPEFPFTIVAGKVQSKLIGVLVSGKLTRLGKNIVSMAKLVVLDI